ncbi:MAG TPA: hypothetical protein VIM98_18725 [Dyella sp.]|uniref:hypothetical protein n=1 Tax=Dyella sp. TaxID=1869338 RepID=UPI002F94CCF2
MSGQALLTRYTAILCLIATPNLRDLAHRARIDAAKPFDGSPHAGNLLLHYRSARADRRLRVRSMYIETRGGAHAPPGGAQIRTAA